MTDTLGTPAEVVAFAEENGVEMVDLKLVDLPGAMLHLTVPAGRLTEELFAEGAAFDRSSIRGFRDGEGDVLLVPDPATAAVDPVPEIPTLSLLCDILDPAGGGRHPRDARRVAQRAALWLEASGVADASRWEVFPGFFVFDSRRPDGYGRPRRGRRAAPPADTASDIRSEAAIKLAGFGVEVAGHSGVDAGRGEIAFESGTLAGAADAVLLCKYVLKGTARDYGRAATFMPMPADGAARAGMRVRQSLWHGGRGLFHGGGTHGRMGRYAGGLLAHAPALAAFCAPGTNSYRGQAPTAAVRLPGGGRVEFAAADGTCNPYLAFAAMLMAGADGILNETDPAAARGRPPASLGEALDALEADHEFLTRGGVFTADLIGAWIEYKRANEVEEVRRRPHPHETALYFDA